MKKAIALLLTAATMMTLLTGCGSKQDDNSAADDTFHVGVVTGVGGLGDGSFNDLMKQGCDEAKETYGITYDLIETAEASEFEGHFITLCEDGSYDVIVCGGFDAVEPIQAVAPKYPNQKFIFVDGAVTGCDENVTSYFFRDHEKTFMLGVLAALETKTDKLGLVAAMNIDTINMFVAGFIGGAEYVNPDIQVDVKYVGSFADTTTAKEMAISMSEGGSDIIVAFAGGSGLGVFTAAQEEGFVSMGCDTNQCLNAPDVVMASGMRMTNVVISDGIGAAIEGKLVGGASSVGLAEGALTITNEGSNVEIDSANMETALAAGEEIVAGTLVAPSTLAEVGR